MNRIIAHRKDNGEKEFALVELRGDELWKIRKRLRAKNLRLFKQCIKDAVELIGNLEDLENTANVFTVATALFDKLANNEYSEEQKALTKKIHWIKEAYETYKTVASLPTYESEQARPVEQ